MKEEIKKWIDTHEGEDYCEYCIYNDKCNGLHLGPNGPVYPPCCDRDIEGLLNLKQIEEEIRGEIYV